MALDRIVDRPLFSLTRRKPDLIALADRARDAGQWEAAAQFYRKVLDRYPRNSGTWVQYGHALKESGELRDPDKLAQAEKAYRTALSLDPGAADTYVQLGHVLKLQGETEEARGAYLRAFALDPSMPYALQELSGLGWSEAEMAGLRGLVGSNLPPASSSALEAVPRNDARRGLKESRLGLMRRKSSVIDLADRARDARQWERAAQLYRKALDRNRRNPPIWVQYGHALKESGELKDPGKLAQAELAYRRALSLDPGGADAYLQLGHVLKLQGKTEEAQAAYLRAFALDAAITDPLEELRKLGWSQVKLAELRGMAKGRIGERGFSRVHPGGARFTEDVGAARGLGTREPVEVPVVGANAIHRDAALITSKRAADGPESSCASGKTTVQRRIIDLDQWRSEVVLADPTLAVGLDRPIGIFVHLFYEDLAEEIASFLVRIDLPKKIYVSTGSDEKRTVILRAFEKFDLASLAEIAIVPDYGTDITPLLITFIDKLSEHDICLKLHSKKSLNAPPEFGEGWRKYLFDELIGDYDRVRAIVATMLVSTDLGLLMAQHYPPLVSSIGMGENFELVRDILAKISVDLVPDQKLEFPAGSMFWFRSDALAGLAGLGFNWHDFGHAVDHRDGTLAHAMERCFAFFCVSAGKKWGFLPSRRTVIA